MQKPDLATMSHDNLQALAVMLAAAIAARECAERLGVSAGAEIVDDDDGSSLVITPTRGDI